MNNQTLTAEEIIDKIVSIAQNSTNDGFNENYAETEAKKLTEILTQQENQQGQKESYRQCWIWAMQYYQSGSNPNFETWYENLNTPNKPEEESKGIDLNKFGEKIDDALDNETPESLTKWLTDKRKDHPKEQVEEKEVLGRCSLCNTRYCEHQPFTH